MSTLTPVNLAGLAVVLIAGSLRAEQIYRSAPGPELTNALAELNSVYAGVDDKDPRLRSLIQAMATNFPLVEFDYRTGVAAPRQVVFGGSSQFNGFRFRVPDGGPWDLYWTQNHHGSLWPEKWGLGTMSGDPVRTLSTAQAYSHWIEQAPGHFNWFWSLPGVEGGRECVFWLRFNGAPPQEVFVSVKLVAAGHLPGPDFFAIHGYKPAERPPTSPTPEELVAADLERGDLKAVTTAVRERKIDLRHVVSPTTGRGPLAIAIAEGNVEIIPDLIALGADPNGLANSYLTPVMFAAERGDVEAIEQLVKQGARVDGATCNGSTALMYAAGSRASRAVEKLLQLGADPAPTNQMGQTALSLAVEKEMGPMADLIRQAVEKRKPAAGGN